MVGLFFNIFLPTGAGGDIAKIFYLVKNEEKKLLLGSSVIVDRFIGALTVITMGVIAVFFKKNLDRRIYFSIAGLFIFTCFLFIFLSSRKTASFFYNGIKKILPEKFREKLKILYNVFFKYFSVRKNILLVIGISFILQIFSIFSQYLMAISFYWKSVFPANLNIFFIYIPLIWVATTIPSLGGLGIREFSYVFFFSGSFGKENSFALSLLVLLSILINSFIGAIIFFTLKNTRNKAKKK